MNETDGLDRLLIILNPDMTVTLRGPIGNKAQCYLMLEMAKDGIREYAAKQVNHIVVAPAGALPVDGAGARHG
jgi:hypothetical protein